MSLCDTCSEKDSCPSFNKPETNLINEASSLSTALITGTHGLHYQTLIKRSGLVFKNLVGEQRELMIMLIATAMKESFSRELLAKAAEEVDKVISMHDKNGETLQ